MTFHGSVWKGFALVLAAIALVRGVNRNRAIRARSSAALAYVSAPARYVDPSAVTPDQARRRGEFWSTDLAFPQGAGVAVKVLQDAELFESVFPGYGQARQDKAFWNGYFKQAFDQMTYSPVFMALSAPELMVVTSFRGSYQLFQKFGGDILIFGACFTFADLPAGLLRQDLDASGRPALSGKKVLKCSFGLIPRSMRETLSFLADSGKHAQVSVWGYGFNNAVLDAGVVSWQDYLADSFKRWRESAPWKIEAPLPSYFPRLSWDAFFGQTREESRTTGVDGILVPEGLRDDPRGLREYLAERSGAAAPAGEAASCDVSAASAELDKTLGKLLEFSDKVVVYYVPLTPLKTGDVAPCRLENIRAMVASKAGPRVVAYAGDWKSYGLDYADYLHPSPVKGMLVFDPGLTNAAGARKVTGKIAQLVRQALEPAATAKAGF